MNVESKEFWLKVKEEYNPKENIYICNTSPTFHHAWYGDRQKIIDYAEQFALKMKGVSVGFIWIFHVSFEKILK
jgi:hypothetical protein